MTVVPLKTLAPFEILLNAGTKRQVQDLSDHFPVVASFTWPTATPFGGRDLTNILPTEHSQYMRYTWFTAIILALVGIVLLMCAAFCIITFRGRYA